LTGELIRSRFVYPEYRNTGSTKSGSTKSGQFLKKPVPHVHVREITNESIHQASDWRRTNCAVPAIRQFADVPTTVTGESMQIARAVVAPQEW
jgi:hypothetical protein